MDPLNTSRIYLETRPSSYGTAYPYLSHRNRLPSLDPETFLAHKASVGKCKAVAATFAVGFGVVKVKHSG